MIWLAGNLTGFVFSGSQWLLRRGGRLLEVVGAEGLTVVVKEKTLSVASAVHQLTII